jgi:hypothetical protein
MGNNSDIANAVEGYVSVGSFYISHLFKKKLKLIALALDSTRLAFRLQSRLFSSY